MGRLLHALASPSAAVRFHATMTAAWILAIAPSLLWWRNSVPWLVLMSLWANVAAHWAGLQGALSDRRTKRQQEQDDA